VLAIAVAIPLAGAAAQQENVDGKGILAYGDAVFLFADVESCGSEPELPAAQIFVSTDAAKTWQKHGPALEGSEFEFFHATWAGVWLAGIHTAEGPGIDPFILVPSEAPHEWMRYTIYEGPAALLGVTLEKGGTLLAWVRHIDVHQPQWPGVLYLHRSTDGGRSWKTSGPVKAVSSQSGAKFERIGRRSGAWRLSVLEDGGFSIQHRNNTKGGWEDRSRFPRHDCGGSGRHQPSPPYGRADLPKPRSSHALISEDA
jgi:hypothetical protein